MSDPPLASIRDFLALSNDLGTSGQPTAAQFAAIKAAGYEVVINLALPDSPNALPDERQVVEAQGLAYIHIPVAFDAPQVEDARRFFATMQANAGRKIFVHCAANKRVSAFVYLFRVLRQGVPPAEAERDLHRLWVPDATWQEFMRHVASADRG